MARTAVIAGTATAVSGRVREGQMNREMAEQQQAAPQPEQTAAPVAAPAAEGTDLVSQLQKLGELKASGVLSDAEFAEAKARLLG
jgi:membrane protease subunit (stomatin/prohibitin family)